MADLRASTSHLPNGTESVVIASPIGHLKLTVRDDFLISVGFGRDTDVVAENPQANAILDAAAVQLRCYFDDPTARFTLPLKYAGTSFLWRVWTALTAIPPGSTESYGSLARRLGSGPRAIAAACRANAFAIVIPCHRVVSAHGLGGYCGQTEGPMLEIKRWLLKHEGCV